MGFAEFSFPCSLLGCQELLFLFSPGLCSGCFLEQSLSKSPKPEMVPIYWYLLMKSNGSAHATPNYALHAAGCLSGEVREHQVSMGWECNWKSKGLGTL